MRWGFLFTRASHQVWYSSTHQVWYSSSYQVWYSSFVNKKASGFSALIFCSKIFHMEDTIAAIATPSGEGGIGIIRISGPEAKNILARIFVSGKEEIKPRELTYGHIVNKEKGEIVDEVMACFMPAPATYTKEDVVEINCHGGHLPLSKTLEMVLSQGARMAEPGEFTKRAFLNGRIDLSQAEAVIDLINAKTDTSLDVAITQLEGKFSQEISKLRKALTDILVNVAVNIDYPDEDIEEVTYQELINGLKNILGDIKELIESSKTGKILREGFTVVIIGKPNVGKSSLMNSLLRESRAIVTEIPGTTRDTIEEFVNIKGIPVRLIDTAGIRETEDPVEIIGIEKSRDALEKADYAILLVDSSEKISGEDMELRELIRRGIPASVIFNKEDKGSKISEEEMKNFADPLPYISISLKDSEGVKAVERLIFNASGYSPNIDEGVDGSKKIIEEKNETGERDMWEERILYQKKSKGSIVTNIRHKNMLTLAEASINDAIKSAEKNAPLELIEIDITSAYENLGFITGDSVQEDIIEQVFERFCLGK